MDQAGLPHLPPSLCQPLISQLTFQVEVVVKYMELGHQATWFLVPTLFLIRCVILGEFSPL